MALGGSFPKTAEGHFACAASQKQVHKECNTGLKIFEVFTYFSYMYNRRKRLYHIFVNNLINDKRMRLSAANPNYWLMLKIANSTYFLSSQSH